MCVCVYNGDIVARRASSKETRKPEEAAMCEKYDQKRETAACAEDRTEVCLVRCRNHKEASAVGMD